MRYVCFSIDTIQLTLNVLLGILLQHVVAKRVCSFVANADSSPSPATASLSFSISKIGVVLIPHNIFASK